MIQAFKQIFSVMGSLLLMVQTALVSVPSNDQTAQVNQLATMSLLPASYLISTDNTFAVNIFINTGLQKIYGADVNGLKFNPAFLQVVDSDSTKAGVQISAGTLMLTTVVNEVDNTAGLIKFSQISTPSSTFIGSGNLATITFKAVSAGVSNVVFDFTSGDGKDANMAGASGDILTSIVNGTYTITGVTTPPDNTTPPGTNPSVSTQFTSGQRIRTTSNLVVRNSASISNRNFSGLQFKGSLGTIIGGGQSSSGYIWWNINYDSGVDGWSVGNYMELYSADTEKFIIGDKVYTTSKLNVRATPGFGWTSKTQPSGANGTIIGGPKNIHDYTWWNIDYISGPDGWSVENWLEK
jgi:hypothetical protein